MKDEKLYYFVGSLKNLTFREGGGGSQKTNIEGGLPKKWGLDSLPIYGGQIPQCTLCLYFKIYQTSALLTNKHIY